MDEQKEAKLYDPLEPVTITMSTEQLDTVRHALEEHELIFIARALNWSPDVAKTTFFQEDARRCEEYAEKLKAIREHVEKALGWT